jgi:cytoskeleton protein RodZ
VSSSDDLSLSVNGGRTSPTPGQQLRLAREARGLSLEAVNAETNLSVKYLQALEADDFTALPGLAFARGYARRYAQLVHLDAATLIAEIDALAASQGVVVAPTLISSSYAMQQSNIGISQVNTRKASDGPSVVSKFLVIMQQVSFSQILSMGSLLLLLLLLLGTLFWQGSKNDVVEPLADNGVIDIDAEVAQQIPPEAPVSPVVINSQPAVSAGPESSAEVSAEQPVSSVTASSTTEPVVPNLPEASVVASPVAPQATTPSQVPAQALTPPANSTTVAAPTPVAKPNSTVAPIAKAPQVAPGVTPPVATKPGSAVMPVVPPASGIKPVAPVVPPPGIDSLNFSFSGKSWISVRDATGQELVYGLKNAGQAVTVTGQAPFSINIGNVHVTSLSRNGRSVNLKQYARGEIASFRLAPVAPAPVPKP